MRGIDGVCGRADSLCQEDRGPDREAPQVRNSYQGVAELTVTDTVLLAVAVSAVSSLVTSMAFKHMAVNGAVFNERCRCLEIVAESKTALQHRKIDPSRPWTAFDVAADKIREG